ncbi:hypothetical protein [Dyella jiangningensis]|uniref:Uncharacterized protein n=1 Tax=Dyella jiangningensis TaxID=1379159 RepID=A0A328P2P9_9GAMM|nr:hypothetical protein [Dyella jiangningensis]RAO75583.1 hypothetical protein CA260_16110 [Dyella jiangningensis]
MQRKTLLTSAFVLLVVAGGSYAIAQDAAPKSAPALAAKAMPAPRGPQMDRGDVQGFMGDGPGFGRPGFGRPGLEGPGSPVIEDLQALERLYRENGRGKDLQALYNDVLTKTQDPRVRTYVYHHLARAQAAPANIDQAIATLRKSLDENLANEAKQRAEAEKMRNEWEQRRHAMKPAPTTQP